LKNPWTFFEKNILLIKMKPIIAPANIISQFKKAPPEVNSRKPKKINITDITRSTFKMGVIEVLLKIFVYP